MSGIGGGGPDFSLSDEILAVIPTDPYEQLDLARKITSMAIASRVSHLESQVSSLTNKLLEKNQLVNELQGKVSSLERLHKEAESTLQNSISENMKLTQERDSLAITAKKLGRDFAKLEAFKRQLMQSLSDENPSELTDVKMATQEKSRVSQFSPVGTPKMLSSTGVSPRSFSATSSPKMFSGGASPTSSHYDIRLWSSSSQANSPPPSARRPRIDGKEFFRQARSRLSFEQFSAFLANVKELNARKQSREETLRKSEEIFGTDNSDLYISFKGLVTSGR